MATLKDIAQATGISVSTISRVLNRDETLSVTPQTQQLINRQRLAADRAFAAALSGRPLDDALFDTAAAAFAAIPADAPLYQATVEYNEIARPYEPVWETLGFFFSSEELRAETTGWGQAL